MNLQHLALIKMSTSMEYPKDNPVIDNLVYEFGEMKDHLDDDIDALESEINTSLNEPEADLDEYYDITHDIHEVLFRIFNYKTAVQTDLHVQWKEYFHCLYEHCVIDYDSEQFFHFALKSFDLFEPPTDIDSTDSCYVIVQTLKELFDRLKQEHTRITGHLMTPQKYKEFRLNKGRRHLEMIQTHRSLRQQLDKLDGVLEWSKR